MVKAETYLSQMKSAIDKVWKDYGDVEALRKLAYGKGAYGLIQHAELKDITESIESLKKWVDRLTEDTLETVPVKPEVCVLVVDDNTDFLDIAGMFLKKNGIEADTAAGGRIALEMLLEHPKKHSLVLLDIQMQDMDGYGVLKHMRESEFSELSTKPVIAISGKANPDDLTSFDSYLCKPFSFDEFIPSIRRVLERTSA